MFFVLFLFLILSKCCGKKKKSFTVPWSLISILSYQKPPSWLIKPKGGFSSKGGRILLVNLFFFVRRGGEVTRKKKKKRTERWALIFGVGQRTQKRAAQNSIHCNVSLSLFLFGEVGGRTTSNEQKLCGHVFLCVFFCFAWYQVTLRWNSDTLKQTSN